ncbi:MAG: hypothetical protein II743_01535, partial [Lachnospiraceae bacterium]|nr:hypothetical protein [Lachnospiraceae bacterium]
MVSYFIVNFMPLMILLAIVAMMFVNKDVKLPAANLFNVIVFIMFLITVISAVNVDKDVSGLSAAEAQRIIWLHMFMSASSYILRPFLILIEILIIIEKNKYKLLCMIPAIVNALIFSAALFGSKVAFFIDGESYWHAGPLQPSIYLTQLFYL